MSSSPVGKYQVWKSFFKSFHSLFCLVNFSSSNVDLDVPVNVQGAQCQCSFLRSKRAESGFSFLYGIYFLLFPPWIIIS